MNGVFFNELSQPNHEWHYKLRDIRGRVFRVRVSLARFRKPKKIFDRLKTSHATETFSSTVSWLRKTNFVFIHFFVKCQQLEKKFREDFLINLSKAEDNQVFDATYLRRLKLIRSGLVSLLKDLPLIHTRQLIHTTTQIVHIIYKFNTNWWNKCTLTEISEEKILCRHQDLSLLHSNLLLLARALNLPKRTLNLSDWTLWPYW